MSKEKIHEVVLPLGDIQDLFTDPEPGSERFVSGMDYLYDEVRVHTRVFKRANDKYKMTIELPREKITDDLVVKTIAKIKHYCEFKDGQSHKELIVLRHQGLDALRRSIWVVVGCAILGTIATLL